MKFFPIKAKLPSPANSLLSFLSAILLTLAFPDFDLWFLAWFALVPLFYAIECEKQSVKKSFVLGWIFGTSFFFGTCWWLTFAPITYAGVPTIIAYLLLFMATLFVGLFPAIFAACFSLLLRRFGSYAILSAPFLWTATEFLRFNLTGNNWNAIGYSMAFRFQIVQLAAVGGVYLVGWFVVLTNTFLAFEFTRFILRKQREKYVGLVMIFFSTAMIFLIYNLSTQNLDNDFQPLANVIAVQPNVPMGGMKYEDWINLRERHIELAENTLQKLADEGQKTKEKKQPTIVIFPESPMNFMYENDREFQGFIGDFARRNNASVLFNSAQPNQKAENFYNSAVMINSRGEKVAQYDKIHLVPFGEYAPVPEPLAQIVPTMVGKFQYGERYNLLPFGEAKGGVMICFESHFASLSREFVRNGADVLIEMTNDGYLGETPILRQHLANAVFRAVETNRPVLRVTNVGITAYINKRGEVLDAAKPYTQDTRIWTIAKADGSQTFYVRYGDWFAWLSALASLGLIVWSLFLSKAREEARSR